MTARQKRPGKPAEWPPLTDTPCPRCLPLAQAGRIRMETVQRLPEGATAPRAVPTKDVPYTGPCCLDCGAADTVLRLIPSTPGFVAARIAVGTDRQEQYRLPGAPMGLVKQGLVRPSKPGDLEKQHKWLGKNDWFGERGGDRYGHEG